MALPTKVTLTGASESLYAGFTKVNTAIDYIMAGDGTSRAFRVMSVKIENGTVATSIKVTGSSIYNGNTIAAEDNLTKGGDTGNFNLNGAGNALHIESGAITGNATHALAAIIYLNKTDRFLAVQPSVVSNGITLTFTNLASGSSEDLTAAVDNSGGELYITVIYLTDA